MWKLVLGGVCYLVTPGDIRYPVSLETHPCFMVIVFVVLYVGDINAVCHPDKVQHKLKRVAHYY